MTEKLYIGTLADVQTVRLAMDFLYNYPMPGVNQQTQQPIVDNATRDAMRAAWFSMSQAARDAIIANPGANGWSGWTLQWSELISEPSPGVRNACWTPAAMTQLIQEQAALGRTLTLAQALACSAAALLAISDFPANWIFTD